MAPVANPDNLQLVSSRPRAAWEDWWDRLAMACFVLYWLAVTGLLVIAVSLGLFAWEVL